MSPHAAPAARERLRVAIQKSGRLAEPARTLLAACGLDWRESRDRLFCHGETAPVDLLLVRDDDIPGLIAAGACDLGIVGRNVLLEQSAQAASRQREWRALGFGQCTLQIAVPEERNWSGPVQLGGLRIATSYPGLLSRWLEAQGIAADVVALSGSVEIAPRLGVTYLQGVCRLRDVGEDVVRGATDVGRHRETGHDAALEARHTHHEEFVQI